MRIDQWLWAVRVFKTRSLAAEQIKGGRVEVDARRVKPAHEVRPGEVVHIRMEGRPLAWTRVLRVLGAPASRVGAALVGVFAEDHTPPEEWEKARTRESSVPGARPAGAGRPTKRDRRLIGGLGEEAPED